MMHNRTDARFIGEQKPLLPKILAIDKKDENFIEGRDNGELYDLRPQNVKQLCAFYKLLQESHPDSEETMHNFFRQPMCEILFNERVNPNENNGQRLQFDQVNHLLQFLTQVWQISIF